MPTNTGPWMRLARAIDALTDRVGRSVSWLAVLMVLVGAYNAIARYLGRFIGLNLSSNAYIEFQWYLFSIIFLLAAGYALKQDAHVRVDVLFGRLSARVQAWINIAGAALLLLPFCIFAIWVALPPVRNSFIIREMSPDPGGLPRWPLKALIPVCFILLALQGIAEIIKEIDRVQAGEPAVPDTRHHPPEGL